MNSRFGLALSCFLSIGLIFSGFAHAEFPADKVYVPIVDQNQSFTSSLAGKNKVALTFDDGPDLNLTPKLLDLLKERGYQATFFLVGERITAATKPIVFRALQEGHLIGSHSMHHRDSNTLPEADFREDLRQSVSIVRDLIAESGISQNEVYFRFPYGNYGAAPGYHHFNVIRDVSQQIFGANCINFAFWSIDPSDGWGALSPSQLFTNIFSYFDGGMRTTIDDSVSPAKIIEELAEGEEINHGGVLLMHDVHEKSLAALPAIFDEFERRKIKVVPLNSLPEYRFRKRACGDVYQSSVLKKNIIN